MNSPLAFQNECVLTPSAPFHFDGTVWKQSYFPGSDTAHKPGHFWQTMRFEGECYGIHMDNLGSIDDPALRLTVFSSQPIDSSCVERIFAEITVRYDLQTDLTSFYDSELRNDPLLSPVLERWRGVRPSTYTSLYEYLVIATTLQNATVRRTVQMMENLFTRYGSRLVFDGLELSAFWDPEIIRRTDEADLRALKVGYRAKTLKRQAESFGPGGLDEAVMRKLSTAELKKQLLSIYGVGNASVWYLLFGQFRRYDAFEYVSPWEQKIYSRLLFDSEWVDARTILAEVDHRWGSWKMLAAHLLFEDLFWRHKNEPVEWLSSLIRL